MRVSAAATAAALAALACVGEARAQQATLATAPKARETDLSASVDVVYDSNVARSDRAIAAARGLSLADELFTPRGDFTIARQLGREVLFLQGTAGYQFHRTNTVLNRENIDITGGINTHVLRCQELVTGSYLREQADLAEQSRLVVRNAVQISKVGLDADCGRAIGLAPTASVSQSWRTNSAPRLALNNSDTFSATGGLAYRQPALGSLSLFGSFSQTSFPDNQFIVNGVVSTAGFKYYSGGATYDRHLGGRIEGSASISYSTVQPDIAFEKGFNGLTFALDGTYKVNSRLDLKATAVRAVVPSQQVGSNYSVTGTYEVDVSYALGTRLDLSVIGLYRTLNNGTGTTAGVPIDLTHSTTESVFASGTYKLSRRFSFTLMAGDEDRQANFTGLSYNGARVGLTFTATY